MPQFKYEFEIILFTSFQNQKTIAIPKPDLCYTEKGKYNFFSLHIIRYKSSFYQKTQQKQKVNFEFRILQTLKADFETSRISIYPDFVTSTLFFGKLFWLSRIKNRFIIFTILNKLLCIVIKKKYIKKKRLRQRIVYIEMNLNRIAANNYIFQTNSSVGRPGLRSALNDLQHSSRIHGITLSSRLINVYI